MTLADVTQLLLALAALAVAIGIPVALPIFRNWAHISADSSVGQLLQTTAAAAANLADNYAHTHGGYAIPAVKAQAIALGVEHIMTHQPEYLAQISDGSPAAKATAMVTARIDEIQNGLKALPFTLASGSAPGQASPTSGTIPAFGPGAGGGGDGVSRFVSTNASKGAPSRPPL